VAKKPAKPVAGQCSLGADCRIVILHGKEAFIRAEMTAQLRGALAQAFGAIDSLTFEGASAAAADVLDECRSFGLIAAHKLVIVDDADDLVKGDDIRPLFERYAQSPSEGSTLVLRTDTWKAGRLDKLVEAVGVIIECKPPDERRAVEWTIARARDTHACAIDQDAASLLVRRVGADLGKIDSELGKLSAAAGAGIPQAPAPKGPATAGTNAPAPCRITADSVEYFVGPSRDEQVWGIQSTLLSAGPEESLQHLRNVLDVSRQPAQLVLYALMDISRKLHGASRAMRAGARPDDLAGPLKLWGESKFAIPNAAKRLEPARALQLFRTCVEADRRSKSGLGEVERTLERLVVQFSRAVAAPR